MSHRPFLIRLILPFAALIVMVVAACGLVIHFAGVRAVRNHQERDLRQVIAVLDGAALPPVPPLADPLQAELRAVSRMLAARVTLVGPDGAVLFDTERDAQTMENHNRRAEIVSARRTGFGTSSRVSATTGESSLYVARALGPASPGVIVRIAYQASTWDDRSFPVWLTLSGALIVSAVLMILMGAVIYRTWVVPIRRLAETTTRMGDDWSARLEPTGAGEIRALTLRVNQLAAQAQRQLADLNARRADLQALVDTLPDPILLSDSNSRIVLLNAPAARLLQVTPAQAIGQSLVNVINEEQILSLLERVEKDNVPALQQREIRLLRNGQRLVYHGVVSRAQVGGMLLVLRDVTALASTIQMKTDFVANASHELRTPISAIKIAFETLQDVYREDAGQTRKCIGVIDGQLRRLEEMLGDLLDLSRVESPDLHPELATIRAEAVLAPLRATMTPMAQQKGLTLTLEGPADFEFASDRRLLDLILKNLIENAVKFTPTGGTVSATIQPSAGGAALVITVRDTGIGIAPEHVDRVFERFYQVDAARSGSARRGTGLGLAIVKHAVSALRGSIRLESKLGSGTTVVCTLPLQSSPISGGDRLGNDPVSPEKRT